MPLFRFLAPALIGLAVGGAPLAASAESFSDTQRGDIETIVRNYLIAHPEVLEEAMTELSKRQAAAEAEKHQASISKNADTIFNSPRGVTIGNKDGDVTFVEFFDYNCGYCKRAMSDMLDLMKSDPKLKVVLKEFPVLSQGSVEAAQVAVAVRMQDPTGKKYLDFHQKLLGGRGAADKARALAVAKEVGLDVARIEKDMTSPEAKATIEENFRLAESMGMNGTPSYVIGKQVVIGAIGLDNLKEKIGVARCGKATC
ncbi:DsbA family protein [Bradyrhizobium lablabi]|uniref:DsbA family protein n=1 Tax=Bradyrhizobium lablabi TaxID=722472 RepID=UPI001BA66938|nr:DsbA family protein [Bradyrhizobium lablabi]MBR0692974.1 DsbA family protein [Bradyrhizobium lablabi]